MQSGIILTGGLILVVGAVAGRLAQLMRLPTLTGYLAAGILLGAHGFDLLPRAHGEALSGPVTDITMALVLFVLGGRFRLDKIRGRTRRTLTLSGVEALATFLFVTAVTWPLLSSFSGGLLLGVMAVAIAPATTLVVLQEYASEGPTSDTIQLLTSLSNIWSIFFFELALLVLFALRGGEARVDALAWAVAGSVVYGFIAGHVLILLQERTGFGSYALPLLSVLLLTIGVCKVTGVPFMLVFLVTGSVVANRSRFFEPITGAMENFAQPAYVAFFVLSGWHLDFHILAQSWLVGGAYVVARTAGKLLGAWAGMRFTGMRLDAHGVGTPPLGLGLLCQAGAAIALAHLAKQYDPELGQQLLNVILGAVAIFELAGPLLLKRVVVGAGEVRLGQLMVRPSGTSSTPWLRALRRMLGGSRALQEEVKSLSVRDIMRVGTKPLSARADMDEMLRYANHSPFNQFPVVDDQGRLRGMIRLKDLSELVYDPHAAALVIAEDLVTVRPDEACLTTDCSLDEAARLFGSYAGNTVPVVEEGESQRYRGVVERAEVLRTLRHARYSN